jgi:hypothetical protein
MQGRCFKDYQADGRSRRNHHSHDDGSKLKESTSICAASPQANRISEVVLRPQRLFEAEAPLTLCQSWNWPSGSCFFVAFIDHVVKPNDGLSAPAVRLLWVSAKC